MSKLLSQNQSIQSSRYIRYALIAGILLTATYIITGIFSLNQFRASGPFWDQFDFLGVNFRTQTLTPKILLGVFLHQHGPHRMGVGGITNAILLKSSGYNFRLLSHLNLVLIGTIGFISAFCSLNIFARLKINLSESLAGYFLILILWLNSNPHAESLYLAANPAHSAIAIFLLLIYLISINSQAQENIHNLTLIILVTAIGITLASTGFGIFFAISLTIYHSFKISALPIKRLAVKYNSSNLDIIYLAANICGLLIFTINRDSGQTASLCTGIPGFPIYIQWIGAQVLGVFQISIKNFELNSVISILALINFIATTSICIKRGFGSHANRVNSLLLIIQFSYISFAMASCLGRGCSGIEAANESRYNLWPLLFLTTIFIQFYSNIWTSLRSHKGANKYLKTPYLIIIYTSISFILIIHSSISVNKFLVHSNHYSNILQSLKRAEYCAKETKSIDTFNYCIKATVLKHPLHPSEQILLSAYKDMHFAQ